MLSNVSFNSSKAILTPAKETVEKNAKKFVSDTALVSDETISKVDGAKLNEAYKAIYTPFGAPTGIKEAPAAVKGAAPEVFY